MNEITRLRSLVAGKTLTFNPRLDETLIAGNHALKSKIRQLHRLESDESSLTPILFQSLLAKLRLAYLLYRNSEYDPDFWSFNEKILITLFLSKNKELYEA